MLRRAKYYFTVTDWNRALLTPKAKAKGRERERERENKLYFPRVVEKTRGLFTSSSRPWRKLLLIKDTMSYSMLNTCTFIQTMLKWTPVNRGERERERQTDRQTDRNRERETETETETETENEWINFILRGQWRRLEVFLHPALAHEGNYY